MSSTVAFWYPLAEKMSYAASRIASVRRSSPLNVASRSSSSRSRESFLLAFFLNDSQSSTLENGYLSRMLLMLDTESPSALIFLMTRSLLRKSWS